MNNPLSSLDIEFDKYPFKNQNKLQKKIIIIINKLTSLALFVLIIFIIWDMFIPTANIAAIIPKISAKFYILYF